MKRDQAAQIVEVERPPAMAPAPPSAPSIKPSLSDMRKRWIRDVRPEVKQVDDSALYVGYFVSQFGDLPVDRITRAMLTEFTDLLSRCPRNVPHAIRRASLEDRVAWGEKPVNFSRARLARRTINAKGLGSMSAALAAAERLGHIEANPCAGMGMEVTKAEVVKRAPYGLRDLRRIFSTSVYMDPIDIPLSGCGPVAHWLPLL